MTLFEFFRKKSTDMQVAYSKDKRRDYAREFFGSDNLSATTGEFLFYRTMQVILQVATAGLLAYGFFHFFKDPFENTFENGTFYAQVLSALLVIGYELLKFFTIRRAMFLLIKGLKEHYMFFFKALIPLIFGLILAFGSWKGANSGAEHMAIQATDKSKEIKSTSDTERKSLENQYRLDMKAAQEAGDAEIAAARKALSDYQASVAWKGHIDTRNKDVVSTIKNKTEAIADAKKEKKEAMDKVDLKYKNDLLEIEGKETVDLNENGTKQSFYQNTVFYGSIALEVFVFVFIFLIMSWLHEDGNQDYEPVQQATTKEPVNVPMGNGQKKSDPKSLREHRLALNQRAMLKTRIKKHYSTGEFEFDALVEQWENNEDRLLKASRNLGVPYTYEDIPEEPETETA